MISTYTTEIQESFLQEYLGYNLIAILIYKPSLGITDSPTPTELAARKSLTMLDASALEVVLGHGYKRAIVQPTLVALEGSERIQLAAEAKFIADSTGAIAAATHICYVRGANLIGAAPANGNNRGDTAGILIKVEPLANAPLSIAAGVTFIHQTIFEVGVGL